MKSFRKKLSDYQYFIGCELICNVNNSVLGIYNSDKFIIEKIMGDKLSLKNIRNDDIIELDTKYIDVNFGYIHALTCYKYQGETIKEHYGIVDLVNMSKKEAYIALSRGVKYSRVHFDYINKIFEDKIQERKTFEIELTGLIEKDLQYKNSKIYKIIHDGKIVYIGSTVKYIQIRFNEHKK